VVDAIKQAMGSFVSFTFSTKFVCRVNQILTVIAVIQIQNLRQAFMSKSHDLMSRNVNICISRTHRFLNLTVLDMKIIGVRRRSIRPSTEHYSRPVLGNIAQKFGCEKLTGFLNHKPD
jgi:hypothetical protein